MPLLEAHTFLPFRSGDQMYREDRVRHEEGHITTLRQGFMNEDDFVIDDYYSEEDDAGGDGGSSSNLKSIEQTDEEDCDDDDVPIVDTEGRYYEPGYNLLSCADVFNHIEKVSIEVGDVTNLSPANCRILLRKFGWDREKFINEYTMYGEYDTFLSAHIHDEDNRDANSAPRTNMRIDPSSAFDEFFFEGECETCGYPGVLRMLSCQHFACEDCWNEYFTVKINDGELEIRCIYPECNVIINDEMMKKVFSKDNKDLKKKVDKLHVDNFVHINNKFRWCTGIDCGKIVQLNHLRAQAIFCDCGKTLCSACNDDCHSPLPCGTIQKWKKEPDTASHKWVSEHSRGCPECKAPIEKNGGCNFMKCRNPVCKAPFCWICMKKLISSHAQHDCHIFVPSQHKSKELLEVERYEHYSNRFNIHEQSRQKERRIIKRISYIKRKLCVRNEVSHLESMVFDRSALSLSRARTVAMHTNAFAFYLEDVGQRNILEDNQKNLEAYTEKLSSQLEKDLEDLLSDVIGFRNLAKKLTETHKYLDKRRDILLQHCDECVLKKFFKV